MKHTLFLMPIASPLRVRLFRGLMQSLILTLLLAVPSFAGELYDQPPFTPAELDKLIDDLPRFRAWVKANGEKVHPVLATSGKPSFLYSPKTAAQVEQLGWEPGRFFCVMGRAAAALAIIEQGADLTSSPPADMPRVSPAEMDAVRHNLTGLLQASSRPVDETPSARSQKPSFSDKATGRKTDRIPDKMPEKTPEKMPEKTSEKTSDKTSSQPSGATSGKPSGSDTTPALAPSTSPIPTSKPSSFYRHTPVRFA